VSTPGLILAVDTTIVRTILATDVGAEARA